MAHKIIETLISLIGILGIVVFLFAFTFAVMDVIDIYLRFRKHVLNGDLYKGKDRE